MTVVTYNGIDFTIPFTREDPRFKAYDAMARAHANAALRQAEAQVAPEVAS